MIEHVFKDATRLVQVAYEEGYLDGRKEAYPSTNERNERTVYDSSDVKWRLERLMDRVAVAP